MLWGGRLPKGHGWWQGYPACGCHEIAPLGTKPEPPLLALGTLPAWARAWLHDPPRRCGGPTHCGPSKNGPKCSPIGYYCISQRCTSPVLYQQYHVRLPVLSPWTDRIIKRSPSDAWAKLINKSSRSSSVRCLTISVVCFLHLRTLTNQSPGI